LTYDFTDLSPTITGLDITDSLVIYQDFPVMDIMVDEKSPYPDFTNRATDAHGKHFALLILEATAAAHLMLRQAHR